MNIYQIGQEFLSLYEAIESNEGEITPELEQALAINKDNLQVKAIGYHQFMTELKFHIDQAKKLKENIDVKIKSFERAYEKCEGNIKEAMNLFNIRECGNSLNRFSFRKSEIVEVENAELLPDELKVIKVSIAPDKKAIKEALKRGEDINGCKLIEKENLQLK